MLIGRHAALCSHEIFPDPLSVSRWRRRKAFAQMDYRGSLLEIAASPLRIENALN
jgi:hypothetical protein